MDGALNHKIEAQEEEHSMHDTIPRKLWNVYNCALSSICTAVRKNLMYLKRFLTFYKV